MTDIRERLARACFEAIPALLGPKDKWADLSECRKTFWYRQSDAILAQLPLTQAQLEGLASGDMVVVPDNDWSFWAKVVELPAKRKKFIYDLIAMEAAE